LKAAATTRAVKRFCLKHLVFRALVRQFLCYQTFSGPVLPFIQPFGQSLVETLHPQGVFKQPLSHHKKVRKGKADIQVVRVLGEALYSTLTKPNMFLTMPKTCSTLTRVGESSYLRSLSSSVIFLPLTPQRWTFCLAWGTLLAMASLFPK
jgi:hypothetical protein